MKWIIIQYVLSFVGFTIAFGGYSLIERKTSKRKPYSSGYGVKDVLIISAIVALVVTFLNFFEKSML